MTEVKVTTYVLTVVDLQCCKCYNKVKKLLCKYKEIRDQVYDVKKNTVTIKVFCCTPERIRQELMCKGCKFIQCINIPPEKKPEEKPPSPNKKPVEKPPLCWQQPAIYYPAPPYCMQPYWYGGPCYCGCGGHRVCCGCGCSEGHRGCSTM